MREFVGTGRTEMKGRKAGRKGRRILWIILAVVLCRAYWILFFSMLFRGREPCFLINSLLGRERILQGGTIRRSCQQWRRISDITMAEAALL